MLIAAGGLLDGILSSLAPWAGRPSAGHIQHSCMRILWLLFLDRLWVLVSRGLKEGSCQCFCEEQAWWAWGSSHSIFRPLLWCFCLPHQLQKFIFSVIFVCFVEDLGQNAVCLAATCSSISFSHFHGVKANHPSGCLRSLSYWPYSRHLITFLSVAPQTRLDLALLFSSGRRSQWTHHSYLLAIAHVALFVWMPSTASANSVKAHFKVATLQWSNATPSPLTPWIILQSLFDFLS